MKYVRYAVIILILLALSVNAHAGSWDIGAVQSDGATDIGAVQAVAGADWIGITSAHYESHCGHYLTSFTPQNALDGLYPWLHRVNETHWLILDLGVTYNISRVRGRSEATDDPIDVDIFVHPTTKTVGGVWGAAVTTNITTWQDTSSWVEIDTTDKEGRYVKIEIIDTEDGAKDLSFGKVFPDAFTIFDVYGNVTGAAAGQIIFINFF